MQKQPGAHAQRLITRLNPQPASVHQQIAAVNQRPEIAQRLIRPKESLQPLHINNGAISLPF
jgi:hypothetical protein